SMNVEDLKTFSNNYNDVYFHPNSYHCAKLSLGGTLQLVDAVMLGKVRNGIALVRPPGHHSEEGEACGFCIFNNVAIAAEYAKKKYGTAKILIVDWDVHHGQGIQHRFLEDPSVLYFSWHRYEHQQFWPNLRESDYDAIGEGKGTGFNINVPWNKTLLILLFITKLVHLFLLQFNPELILVSAGFDSAIGDPEGEMCATPECFAHLTHLLKSLANGKICIVLEGGYNLCSLSESVCMTVRSLLGDPVPQLVSQMAPCVSAIETIQNVRAVHQDHWNYLKYQGKIMRYCKMKRREIFPVFRPTDGKRDGDLLYALFQFILPLAYGHQPDLVILAVESNSGIQVVTLTHLTHLLQGLSEGRILAIFQDSDVDLMEAMASSLLGDPVIPVESFVYKQESVLVLEKLRQELKKPWKLLQNRGKQSNSYSNRNLFSCRYEERPRSIPNMGIFVCGWDTWISQFGLDTLKHGDGFPQVRHPPVQKNGDIWSSCFYGLLYCRSPIFIFSVVI
uniref:Histone deacetylase domain-containing protein n=1 Tax=Callorhinchus milii TaxID=7868 RepID=A0A4W3J347_CALMI